LKKMGLLVAGFNYRDVAEDEFNAWYDTEHIPERERVPGFLNAERWLGAQDPKISIATYDLNSLDVLQSAAYRAIGGDNLSPWSKRILKLSERLCRIEAEQISPGNLAAPVGAGGMLLFAMNVVPEAEAEFNEWYDTEHVPRLSAVPGCITARRFKAPAGLHRYVALYHLTSAEVCSSKAWEEAAVTPWTVKIRPFTRDRLRLPLRRYEPRMQADKPL
jgi:hypothetical protein